MPRYTITGTYVLYGYASDDYAEVSGSVVAPDPWSAQAAIAQVVGLGDRAAVVPYDLTVADDAARPLLSWRGGAYVHQEPV